MKFIHWGKSLDKKVSRYTSGDARSHNLEANFTLTLKMLYNRCTGIYKFGINTYPQRVRQRSNLGHVFQGNKVRLMGREIW